VNVITRTGAPGTAGGLRARVDDHLGAGLGATYFGAGSWWSSTVGASLLRSDYDGRKLPSSSPNFERFRSAGNLESHDAVVRPTSAFGNLRLRKGAFEAELLGRYGELDSVAEFLDFGMLTHRNRLALRSFDSRAQARFLPWERLSVTGALAFSKGGASGEERLSIGSTDTFPRRKFGYAAWDALLEGRVRL